MYKFLMFLILATLIPFGAKAATIYPGDLIKSPSFSSVYYYSDDGKRHAFPSESVFYSWYDGFEDIRIITDEELGSIVLGKNVTMRPGTKLIKVMTDPKVYAVDGRNLRPISTEAVAESIWGSNWAKNVVDISDVFFTNYGAGEIIDSTDDYAQDDQLSIYTEIQNVLFDINELTVEEQTEIHSSEREQSGSFENEDAVIDVPQEASTTSSPASSVTMNNLETISLESTIESCKIWTTFYTGSATYRDSTSLVWVDRHEGGEFNFSLPMSMIQNGNNIGLLRFEAENFGEVSPIDSDWQINELQPFYQKVFDFYSTSTKTYEYSFSCQRDGQTFPSTTTATIQIVE